MPLTTLVVEDKSTIRQAIVKLTSEHPKISVGAEFDDVQSTVDYLLEGGKADALFLDIKLLGGYAWDVLRALRAADKIIPPVVLISAEEERGHTETLLREFRRQVVDYYYKPFHQKWRQRQNETVRLIE
ncbi:MAG: response regulator, partial [Bacteroidota bacterium]